MSDNMNATALTTIATTYLSNRSDYADNSHEGVISGLKFICTIKKNEKINTNNMTVQDNSSWLTSVLRALTIQNRTKTIHYLKNIIDRSFEIVDSYLKSNDSQKIKIGKLMLGDITDSLLGLRNLQSTYESDRMFVCRLESFIQRILVTLALYKDILTQPSAPVSIHSVQRWSHQIGQSLGTPSIGEQLGTPSIGEQLGTPSIGEQLGTPSIGKQLGTPSSFDTLLGVSTVSATVLGDKINTR
jgi:hypothetical protein